MPLKLYKLYICIALYNAKNKFMEKFPGDVEIAERLTRRVMESDMLIINDRPDSIVKAILGQTLTRATNDYYGHDGRSNNTNTRRSGVCFKRNKVL